MANPSVFEARLFLKAGKVEEALALLESIVRTNAADHAAWYRLALAESQRKRFFPALKAIKRALALAPGLVNYQRFKGLTLANMGAGEEAIAVLLPFVQAHPDDYIALHALQFAYCKSGKDTHAIALGRNILKLEDRMATVRSVQPPGKPGVAVVRGNRRVISFSLWGANPVYSYGAMINARLAASIDWQSRSAFPRSA